MRLLSPDPAEGSGSPSDVVSTAQTAAPPAAAAVLAGDVTEKTAHLEEELAKERTLRKQREIEVADLQDKYHQLKTAVPAPKPKKSGGGWTFFEDED